MPNAYLSEAEHDLIKYGLIVAGVLVGGYILITVLEGYFKEGPGTTSPGYAGGSGSALGNTLNSVTNAATDLITGDNAGDTDYQGYGILGTLGAGVNTLLGGLPDAFGTWLGGEAYDAVNCC